ncbi:uncharacterized protein J4E87_007240 [Alternaria ethzedia]|uniref:uncharacterized protein n=1 Tax=Alternaria viburni TaxID=566460 RepID=UPI0020C3695A|nr:uncharacterized protein J4E79_000275 [Alternaria viburni]XP_049231498.1 uncharacterized protein J4E87_007240 [Alternaria ethzedia]XP_051330210.1 uncharacterized protein J4E85_001367 [Alternaria conjuncta]KAI4620552.1 hypothetical protein J4E87_007240 [Alternaria ethzedia]KAI4669995.1 hypothetical protein J4E79_000275 [Alternaria viburni]KAI4936039.1 hypothetical protein J4E85_001367 [Alternaria conjuncta]
MAVEATRVLLQHFASDQTATSILKNGGKSYSEIAAKELPMLHDNWTRFCAYLWPAASEERLKLIAETIVYIFIFDDVWEMSDESTIQTFQNEFVSRLKAQMPYGDDEPVSILQKAMHATIQGLHDQDGIIGDGGAEVVARLMDFINHPPPPTEFHSLREFLDYRIIDAAVP